MLFCIEDHPDPSIVLGCLQFITKRTNNNNNTVLDICISNVTDIRRHESQYHKQSQNTYG